MTIKEDPQTPWGELGYITYKRTYARRLDETDITGDTEEFPQTIDRVLNACENQLSLKLTEEEKEEARNFLLKLKCSVAGRFLWQLGTKTVDKLGLLSLQNCALVVVNEPVKPFVWTFDALMLGSGVGFNIQRENIHEIPRVKYNVSISRQDTKDADFIVPDSREGWVELLRKVLNAHFNTGKDFTYSTICIRGKGVPIKGFGGASSGPEELCNGIGEINKILNSRVNKKLRSIDCLDIMNIIGAIVVSGNVRRSAQIAIGDQDDLQYLNAKRWDKGNIPNWRAMSNNSVVCNDIAYLPEQFWQGYIGNGEPYGLINLRLARAMGRIGETKYPDPDVAGFNPCGEQSLANYETCCLSEVFLPNISSPEELKKVLAFLYKVNKHSLMLGCHHPETERIVHKNMRMGISMTGYLQATEEQKSWLPKAYEDLRKYDDEYSKKMAWPKSIKLTTVKPSGTLSLLPGVTPGCHPGYCQYFIRRIRASSNSPIVEVCREHGYPIEFQKNFDGTQDRNTVVISFPCSYPEGTVFAKDITPVDQLEVVKRLQSEWSDNSVSCTVYYAKEDLPKIQDWLKNNYNKNVKSISFLLHSDHGFVQAPYEEITEEEYKALVKKVKPITSGSLVEEDVLDSFECQNGACPVK
jgi:ribonucleoside-triphosphate reductase